jgi:hypothetical protein
MKIGVRLEFLRPAGKRKRKPLKNYRARSSARIAIRVHKESENVNFTFKNIRENFPVYTRK